MSFFGFVVQISDGNGKTLNTVTTTSSVETLLQTQKKLNEFVKVYGCFRSTVLAFMTVTYVSRDGEDISLCLLLLLCLVFSRNLTHVTQNLFKNVQNDQNRLKKNITSLKIICLNRKNT